MAKFTLNKFAGAYTTNECMPLKYSYLPIKTCILEKL